MHKCWQIEIQPYHEPYIPTHGILILRSPKMFMILYTCDTAVQTLYTVLIAKIMVNKRYVIRKYPEVLYIVTIS